MTEQEKHQIGRSKLRLIAAALSATILLALTASVGAQQANYSDLPQNHWAYNAVTQLGELGILTGYPDGRFDGTRAASRYELAVVAARLLEAAGSGGGDSLLVGRVVTLERALRRVVSQNYANGLEDRITALEVSLDTRQVEDTEPEQLNGRREKATLPRVQQTKPSAGRSQSPQGVRLAERPVHPFYVGISPGVVSTAGDVYLSLQTGFDGLIGPVGPVLRLTFNSGNRELRFAFDVLGRADLPIEELALYAGLGVGGTVRPEGGSFLLEAPFGGEYLITERVGLFVQLTTSYGFAPVNDVDAEVSTGLNLRF